MSLRVLRRIFLTQNQIVNHVNIFFSAATVDCAGISELYQQLVNDNFVQHLLKNLFVNSIALHLFN